MSAHSISRTSFSKSMDELKMTDFIDASTILFDIHQEIEKTRMCRSFFEYCKEWKKEHTSGQFAKRATLFSIGTLLSLSFSAGSMLFAILSGKAAKEGAGWQDPIIGHAAEWSMLALFSLLVAATGPYQITQMGVLKKIEKEFDFYLKEVSISEQMRRTLIEEKWQMLAQRSQNIFFRIYLMPKKTELPIDLALSTVYEEIQGKLQQTSVLKLFLAGCREIRKRQGSCFSLGCLLTAMGLGSAFVVQSVVYGHGIFYSARKSYLDYEEGVNPSIGGHALEWMAESVAMWSVFAVLREIANVGEVKEIVATFRFHIDRCGDTVWKERLTELMQMQINQIGQNRIFSLPLSLLHQKRSPVERITSV